MWLTVKEVAARLRVSSGLVYEWCKTGTLKCKRFGRPGRRGTIRIAEEDLAAFLAECNARTHWSPDGPLKFIR